VSIWTFLVPGELEAAHLIAKRVWRAVIASPVRLTCTVNDTACEQ
tara:strand:- start:285 stop:419 length:135 start_codon:yes stop_codon:yes gene_type:complete